MISPELANRLAAGLADADWRTKHAALNAVLRADDDDHFYTLMPVFKVGPKGYTHGWIKVGSVGAHEVSSKTKDANHGTFVHRDTGTALGSYKAKLRNGKYVYEVKHADGTKLRDQSSDHAAREAVLRHQNTVYSSFDRDKEPELAGYHDALTGKPVATPLNVSDRKAYERGHAQALSGKSSAADVVKVGPKGYIHGWIKVGDAADSLDLHTDKDSSALTPKRAALHDKIVEGALAGHEPKSKPVATFLGGGPASGKSTVMSDTEGKLVVDADGMKAKLPEYQRMVKNKDKRAAAFAHEESSHLANRTMMEAAKRKLDFTLDGTGDSGIEKLTKKVQAARKGGHSVDAKYVTVDSDEAVRRAMKRAARTGRMVPESTIRATHAAVSRTFKAAIDNNLFDTAELWDNNGREPKLIGRKLADGPFQVHDRAAWEKFLAKGQEA